MRRAQDLCLEGLLLDEFVLSALWGVLRYGHWNVLLDLPDTVHDLLVVSGARDMESSWAFPLDHQLAS